MRPNSNKDGCHQKRCLRLLTRNKLETLQVEEMNVGCFYSLITSSCCLSVAVADDQEHHVLWLIIQYGRGRLCRIPDTGEFLGQMAKR